MATIILDVFCCAGNCLCRAVNSICSDTMKINPSLFSRIGFCVINFIGLLFSLIILFFGSNLLQPFNDYINCPKSNMTECLGISSVYRMSLALVFLHIMVILFSLCGKKTANVMNRHCWTFKLLLLFGLYFSFLFVDNSYFTLYAQIAKYVSLVFIMYQVTATISFAHIININLVDGLDNENQAGKYQFWLIFLSLVFSGLSLYWIVISFIDFSYNYWNIIIVCVTIFMGAGFTFISISNFVTRKRLLTSIYMFSFISYLCWSALNSQPDENRIKENNLAMSIADILIGILYLVMALTYVGFYVKKSEKEIDSNERGDSNSNPLVEDAKIPIEDMENYVSKSHYYFHIFLIFMSIYYCMLLCNWDVIDDSVHEILKQTWSSFWIKLSAVFLTAILYIWILIAPRLFPDREFDF